MQLIESIIDTQRESYDVIGSFNVLDNVELTLEITGNSAPWNNPSFELHGLKSDLTKVRQITSISIVDKANKIVKINLLNQMTTCSGILQLQLIIRDVNRTSSTIFCIKVNKSLEIDKTTSTDSVKIYADLEELNKNITANEAVRNENEGVRETAEELRQLAETEREEKFTQIETHWNNIKDDEIISEVQRSRTSLFEGEKSSLDERINIDLSEINRKFDEGQFIEYNDHNITANNSLAGYTKDMKIEGATYQNLVNKGMYGARIIQFAFTKNNINLFKANTKYSVFINDETGKVNKNQISNDASQHIWKPNNSEFFYTFVTPDHVHGDESLYVYATELNPFAIGDETKIKVLILEGDYTDKSLPSYFEGIKSVGEDEENKISILSCGRNLCDNKNNLKDKFINARGEIIDYPGTNLSELIKVSLNTDYIFKGNGHREFVAKYDISKNFIERIETTDFNTGTNCFYVRVANVDNGTLYQLEESTTPTPYEPYKSDKKDILLPSPLMGLPDGVKNTIEYISGEWCYVQRIDRIILDGTHPMGDYNLDNSKIRNQITVWIKPPLPKFINSKAISDKYVNRRLGDINHDGLIAFTSYTDGNTIGNTIYINDTFHHWGVLQSDNKETCINKAREKLKQNPVTVYYELEAPIITPLDLNPNLISWEGTTHIFSENSISPNLSCKVSTNIPALLSDLKTENKSLKNDLNENNEKIIDSSLYSVENDYRLTLLELGLV